MLDRVVLVTGCNRGLGLEFLRQLANPKTGSKASPNLIIGTCRNKNDPGADLETLLNEHGDKIKLHSLDLSQLSSIPDFAQSVKVRTCQLCIHFLFY